MVKHMLDTIETALLLVFLCVSFVIMLIAVILGPIIAILAGQRIAWGMKLTVNKVSIASGYVFEKIEVIFNKLQSADATPPPSQ